MAPFSDEPATFLGVYCHLSKGLVCPFSEFDFLCFRGCSILFSVQKAKNNAFGLKKVEEEWKRKILFHFRKDRCTQGVSSIWWKWKRISKKIFRMMYSSSCCQPHRWCDVRGEGIAPAQQQVEGSSDSERIFPKNNDRGSALTALPRLS